MFTNPVLFHFISFYLFLTHFISFSICFFFWPLSFHFISLFIILTNFISFLFISLLFVFLLFNFSAPPIHLFKSISTLMFSFQLFFPFPHCLPNCSLCQLLFLFLFPSTHSSNLPELTSFHSSHFLFRFFSTLLTICEIVHMIFG